MLGGKPIVRYKCPRARPRGNVPDKMAICRGASGAKPPAVHMQNRLASSTGRGMNPEARDISESAGFECHVLTRPHALHQGVELCACVDAPAHAFCEGRRGSNRNDRRRIPGAERMYCEESLQRAITCLASKRR